MTGSPSSAVRRLTLGVCLGLAPLLLAWPAQAGGKDAPPPVTLPPGVGQLVVKLAPGQTIAQINQGIGSTTVSVLLASRSIYLVQAPFATNHADPKRARDEWRKEAKTYVKVLQEDFGVHYAEPNDDYDTTDGERFHFWPNGGPTCVEQGQALYRDQAIADQLRLEQVHRLATGNGTVIAVLDTGVSDQHEALSGRLATGGYDYVDDDATPGEGGNDVDDDGDGRVDEGVGHGTFVAGTAAMIAPDAKILPQRVLDSDGRGTVFSLVEAVYDSADQGADVVNMSFGTDQKLESPSLREAVDTVTKAGVVFVASAGNDGNGSRHYPAAMHAVIAVGALDASATRLADYSSHGTWVDVAAPGTDLIGALPCGYGAWSGTSMAAGVVSAQAALLVSAGVKPKDVTKRIDETATKVKGPSTRSGAVDVLRSLGK